MDNFEQTKSGTLVGFFWMDMKGTLSSALFHFKRLVLCSRELYQQLSTKPWDHVMDERTSFGGEIQGHHAIYSPRSSVSMIVVVMFQVALSVDGYFIHSERPPIYPWNIPQTLNHLFMFPFIFVVWLLYELCSRNNTIHHISGGSQSIKFCPRNHCHGGLHVLGRSRPINSSYITCLCFVPTRILHNIGVEVVIKSWSFGHSSALLKMCFSTTQKSLNLTSSIIHFLQVEPKKTQKKTKNIKKLL